jgi:hypothetical protein
MIRSLSVARPTRLLTVPLRHFPRATLKARTQQKEEEPVSIYKRVSEAKASRQREQEEREEAEAQAFFRERLKEQDSAFDPAEERLQDKDFEQFAPLALLTLPVDRIPEDIQRRMLKVFSKHRVI